MNKRLTRGLLVSALLGIAVLGAASCSGRSKSPDFARVDEEGKIAAGVPVNILNHDLRNKVAADLADAQRLPDGRLLVRANIRNSTTKDLNVQVRTVFKDELGLSTGDETEWEDVFFAPQQIMTRSATSRLANARGFTIEVRKQEVKKP